MEPSEYQIATKLRDETTIIIRAIRPEDRDCLRKQFAYLSTESVRLRFHGLRRSPTENEAVDLTEIDFADQVALVATLPTNSAQVIGVGRYIVCVEHSRRQHAEIAFVVLDEYQGKGIGSLLLKHLAIACKNAEAYRVSGGRARGQLSNDQSLRTQWIRSHALERGWRHAVTAHNR